MKPFAYFNASTSRTMAIALFGSCALFAVLYPTAVRPQRAKARAALERLASAQDELRRERASALHRPDFVNVDIRRQFEQRVGKADRTASVVEALREFARHPSFALSNVSIEADDAVAVTFEGRPDRITRFLEHLPALPMTYEIRSLDLTRRNTSLVRARLVLIVFRPADRPEQAPARADADEREAMPTRARTGRAAPVSARPPMAQAKTPPVSEPRAVVAASVDTDPTVGGIVYSSRQQIAYVDGRIVGPGDRIGSVIVREIQPDAILVASAAGPVRRIGVHRPSVLIRRK